MAVGNGSVSGEVVYRWSLSRTVAWTTAMNAGAAFISGSVWLLVFQDESFSWSDYLAGGLCVAAYVVMSTFASVLFESQRRSRLRFGAGEVELVAAQRDGVLIPWSAVAKAQVRWVWPFSMLDVFVAKADEVQVSRLGRDGFRPSRRRTGAQVRYSMPVAGLKPSIASLRLELRRRGLIA